MEQKFFHLLISQSPLQTILKSLKSYLVTDGTDGQKDGQKDGLREIIKRFIFARLIKEKIYKIKFRNKIKYKIEMNF